MIGTVSPRTEVIYRYTAVGGHAVVIGGVIQGYLKGGGR